MAMNYQIVAGIQALLGVPDDATWSPTDQEALIKASAAVKKKIQKILGVTVDGWWGVQSQNALNALVSACEACTTAWVKGKASTFADPVDVARFKACKQTGKSDIACSRVGDNGIGQFGDVTAQTLTPFVAVHADYMISRWGSVHAAARRPVLVRIKGKTQEIKVGDRISERGRIDLNPAACLLYGIKPPALVDAEWRWA